MNDYGPTLPISKEKRCWDCGVTKSSGDFHKGADRCKECTKVYSADYRKNNKEKVRETNKKSYLKNKPAYLRRVEERRIKRVYGLSTKDYESLFEVQENRCLICNKEGGAKGATKLVVDHNHDSRKVRGLLCRQCNTALGGFKDDIGLLKKAVEYMENTDG